MNIPAIYQSLQAISWFQGVWLAGLCVALAFALLWFERAWLISPVWFLLTLLLSIQASLFMPPYMAAVMPFVGLFSAVMIYLLGRGRSGQAASPPVIQLPVLFFQVLLALFVILILWGMVYQVDVIFVAASAEATFLVTTFLALGLFRFVTTIRPLPLGIGMVLIVTAVSLWQLFRIQQPLVLGIWSVLVLLTILVTSYLVQHNSYVAPNEITKRDTAVSPLKEGA